MARGKKKKTNANQLLVSIGKFDDRGYWQGGPLVREIISEVPIQDVKPITFNDYSPSGSTPLNDAVSVFVGQLEVSAKKNPDALIVGLLADESSSMGHLRSDVVEGFNTFINEVRADDTKGGEAGVIMVVMTDGLENASREDPNGDKVKAVVQSKESEGWNFFYLGANQDAWATGNNLGFGGSTYSATFTHDSAGVGHSHGLAASAVNYRKGTTSSDYSSGALMADETVSASPLRGTLAQNGPRDASDNSDEVAPLWIPKDTDKTDKSTSKAAKDIADKVKTGV